MPRRPEPDGSPNHGTARALTDGYARYAEVIREQIRALEAEDLPRLEDLTWQRDRLQEELAGARGGPPTFTGLDPEGRALLERATACLRDALARDRELRDLLCRKRTALAGELRNLARRGGSARKYLTDGARDAPGSPSRVDLRM